MRKALVGLFLMSLGACSPRPVQETQTIIYGPAPDFSLTDSTGRTVTRSDLVGKVWIADFIFTSCAGTCPSMSAAMRRMQDTLPREIKLVSFSVDPDRDTPGVLAEYARHLGADSERWSFLTGQKTAMRKISVEGFKLALDDSGGSDAEPIIHSTRFVLVDKLGQIRGYYGQSDEDALIRLDADARKLL